MCPLGRLYYQSLEKVKLQALALNTQDWGATCHLNDSSKMELHWWLENLENCCAPIFRPNPHLTMTFDVSSYRWGHTFNGQTANGHFSEAELPLSINTKETLAIWYKFSSFSHLLGNSHIKLLSDNRTAVSYIKCFGGMTYKLRTKIVCDLWNKAASINSWLSISNLPGKLNHESDTALRVPSEWMEWHLAPALFWKICKEHALTPSVDLFASRLNAQLLVYASFSPDPFSTFVDAFSISWSQFDYIYAYPPFNLLSRTISKIRREGATAILICPAWPGQA